MNEKVASIKKRYAAGEIKQQHLESIVFEEVYGSDKASLRDACDVAARIRCEDIEEKTGVSLDLIKNSRVDNCSLVGGETILAGIEMKVGAALVPMGIAGPVRIKGNFVNDEEIYIPLATNEAALIAGVQRGIKAINMAGGINTIVTFDGMTRAPLIEAPDIRAARALIEYFENNQEEAIERYGKFARDPFVNLDAIECYQLSTKVFLRLYFKTGDAMGMNGVTKASADITRAILADNPTFKLITISSNLCSDKKNAHINVLNGRGKSIQTEVFIPEEVLQKCFKKGVNSRSVERVVFHKCYLGSCLAGTISGFNVNAANPIAAFYAATGQDLAQVVCSSSGYIQAEAVEGGLHFMSTFPCMELATIGGGTMFGTARECLKLLGCDKFGSSVEDNKSVMRLAEIAAVTATCLDLNTACAQAAGYEMADSHVKLARGEKA